MNIQDKISKFCIAVVAGLIIYCFGWHCGRSENTEPTITTDTIILEKWDTLTIEKPTEIVRYITRFDTITKSDTIKIAILNDSTAIIPIECAIYRDSTENAKYAAFLSGFRPQLDSIQIECLQTEKIITNEIRIPPRRFGVGIQAGIGYSGKFAPYVGIGVQYRLW